MDALYAAEPMSLVARGAGLQSGRVRLRQPGTVLTAEHVDNLRAQVHEHRGDVEADRAELEAGPAQTSTRRAASRSARRRRPPGPVSLIWLHCDGLIWPHLRHAGAVL
jgi:hypothetical protein